MFFTRRLDPAVPNERRPITIEPHDDAWTVKRSIIRALEVIAVHLDGARQRTAGRLRHRHGCQDADPVVRPQLIERAPASHQAVSTRIAVSENMRRYAVRWVGRR